MSTTPRSTRRLRSLVAALPLFAACGGSDDTATSPTPATTQEGASVPLAKDSPWPKFRGDAAQSGQGHVKPTQIGGAFWVFPTGKGIFSSPVVAGDGTVYVGSADRAFYALAKDGTVKWKVQTGEIIDSSALLDDRGHVYFGSGDGKLRALDAKSGAEVWTFTADDPSVNKAFIRWFEGNVAIGKDGKLWAPNDNFFLYGVDRDTGMPTDRVKMPDQTWSSPAVDAKTGRIFVGNNNLLPLLGKNLFAIDPSGELAWETSTLGSIAASPMLTSDGQVVVGGFDGYVRAYDAATGDAKWSFGTRDHIYASPASLPDGTIVQPSADGTVYALDPKTGNLRWAFDTREPIRSSPAVDADGNTYVGASDGRLYVLRADGTLRFSMQLTAGGRNDLNASPALGADAIYVAGESGEVFSVPYDYCLRDANKGDPRCNLGPGEDLPSDGARLYFTTELGSLLDEAPVEIAPNQPVALSLLLREGGDTRLAILDAKSVTVTVDPPVPVTTEVSGDGRFMVITPDVAFSPGPLSISVSAGTLVDLAREGLKLSGGKPGAPVSASFTTSVPAATALPFSLTVPQQPGDPSTNWELSRLALPLPTIMPSYNQIGFDSLHYLVGLVESAPDGRAVAWMIGALPEGEDNHPVVDPATKALVPLTVRYDGGFLTLENDEALSVEVMSAVIPFRTFRLAMQLDATGAAVGASRLTGSTVCGKIGFYGPFLQKLGLCNPQTDVLSVVGAALWKPHATPVVTPAEAGAVSFARDKDRVVATLTGSKLQASAHVASVLLVDAALGTPVTLDYGLATKREVASDGSLQRVEVAFGMKTPPSTMRAYLMVDTSIVAKGQLTQ